MDNKPMNPEQRAENLVSNMPDYARDQVPYIAAEIQAAVDEQREECAKIAENAALQPGAVIHVEEVRMGQPYINGQEWGNHIASRIRARATHEAGEEKR